MNRRTVLRQSVKIAYATPLIVATMHLAEQGTLACSPACHCGPCEIGNDVDGCVPIPGCIPE